MRYKKNNYIIWVLIAIGVLITNQFIIQFFLHKKREDSRIINLAGRQRMLSQKIILQYHEILSGDTLNNTLSKTFDNWQQVHYSLIYGNNKLNIKPILDINLNAKLLKLTPKIIFAAKIVLQKPTAHNFKILKQNQSLFLIAMDGVVNDLDEEANKKLLFIIFLEIILCLLSIIIIVIEIFAVYKPFFREQKLILKRIEASESKLRAILNSTTDSNIFISPNLKIINFNKAAQQGIKEFYGKEVKIDQDFDQYIIPGTEDGFYNKFGTCLKGEIVRSELNLNMCGTEIWFCNTFFPVYNDKNKIIGVSFNSTNIDVRKKAEIKIEAQINILKEIAWEESHLVRSPLANILGLTKLLKDNKNNWPSEEKDIFEKLIHEVNRLDKIITGIVKKTSDP